MALFVVIVAVILVALSPVLAPAFEANLALNSIIAAILLIGIVYIFRQVWMLNPEVAWIENFRNNDRAILSGDLPRLMSPMANMLGERGGRRLSLSPVSMRTLLDGIGARLDEQRETSRYLIGTLVFMGLLGTFYGLLLTVHSVGGVLNSLSVGGGDVAKAMGDLKASLQEPLNGMGTAFSSSLFGLAGSLVLGFLDLQAGQAHNRFFNDLEEWLSGLTRIGGAGVSAEGGEPSVPAFIQALLEQTADSLDNLQRIMARGEESRMSTNHSLEQLGERLSLITDQMRTEQSVLLRFAETQAEMRPILQKLADARSGGAGGLDDVSRGYLRSLEQNVGKLTQEFAHGREATVSELRTEIRLLARTIAALAEETER
ncbi:flagellar motor protein MotA [Aliidongia dinghuensis]|uniref:Flagellar motor protein MotA n=2 Tax=Aliidongia dinghuensis TaxID=1867774 RepID=A0A8J2YSQ2_9PROT|nr:flagellar motor protein MotA [Aliidongia dinghuensis]